MHVLRLDDNLLGFYEGRTPGVGDDPAGGWVEDGALSLGICSYALVDDAEAIVYDTHVSVDRAQTIRDTLEGLGARRIRVVLSHWHLDHIAGTEAFSDCEIIANRATAELLAKHRTAIEAGALNGPPAIAPLVLPTTTFADRMDLDLPNLRAELVQFAIHSRDATVIRVPALDLMLDYAWPGNYRELEQCIKNVLIRRDYRPSRKPAEDPGEALAQDFKAGRMTADQLLSRYCVLVYRHTGSYEETARRLQLDRRTVKSKIVAAG